MANSRTWISEHPQSRPEVYDGGGWLKRAEKTENPKSKFKKTKNELETEFWTKKQKLNLEQKQWSSVSEYENETPLFQQENEI